MAWSIIIVLLVVGILFILLEILVIPGIGVAGILGGAMIAVAIWKAYAHDVMSGHLVLLIAIVASALGLFLSLQSKTWNRVALNTDIDGKVNTDAQDKVVVGDRGITVSRLAPSGKARINNIYIEVRTIGQFLDQNVEIEIIKTEGNSVFVKAVEA
ncbi:MAG: hypothetical protein JEZ03_14030 [Bacteroidales bacterium]|nr:hypothetical protein [Bacteroidales bacterium]